MNWQEVCENPVLRDLPFKIEMNGWGKILMSPAKNIHGIYQSKISHFLLLNMPKGEVITECGVQTSDNVKVADVAWISEKRFNMVKDETAYSIAPEICVEILSPGNTRKEMLQKQALYFKAGAIEFWTCSESGEMKFYNHDVEIKRSILIPDFPERITI
ncbi:putative restriction endonuclease domain-containing protein [Candidatus Magnetomoraceae bacterium gMMP-13]